MVKEAKSCISHSIIKLSEVYNLAISYRYLWENTLLVNQRHNAHRLVRNQVQCHLIVCESDVSPVYFLLEFFKDKKEKSEILLLSFSYLRNYQNNVLCKMSWL